VRGDEAVRTLSFERLILAVIVYGYFVVAALYAIYTPAWQTPDEPAHYNYVAQVANFGCCPKIEAGDWDAAYQDELKAAHFPPELLGALDTIQYEDHQPPLYYLLASVVYKLTNGSLTALRLFSALIGLIIVLCAYAIGRVMLPERPQVALGAAALVAFLPQHVALLASVNNDCLGWAVVGVTLLATVRYIKDSTQRRKDAKTQRDKILVSLVPWWLGILVGIGFLTKASTYFLAGLVPLAIVLKWWITRRALTSRQTPPKSRVDTAVQERGLQPESFSPSPRVERGPGGEVSIQKLARDLALFLIPALILGGVWWARNVSVYGVPDFLGLRAHDLVVADQPRTAERIADIGFSAYLSESLQITFNSFWGQFGWMALPLPNWMYLVLTGLLAFADVGLVLDRTILNEPPRHQGHQEGEAFSSSLIPRHSSLAAWGILLLTLLLAMLQYIYYNTEFLQLQGRYLFTGLIPFALWMAMGVDAWVRLAMRVLEGRLVKRPYENLRWLMAVAFLPFAVLDVYLLWRFIVPLLSP
jgi:hypothetical protein